MESDGPLPSADENETQTSAVTPSAANPYAVNPYAAPPAVSDSALVGPPAEYSLTRMQLVQTAVLASLITVITVGSFSVSGPSHTSKVLFTALVSLSIGVPSFAVLLLAGYRGSRRAKGERTLLLCLLGGVALSAMGIIVVFVEWLSNMHASLEMLLAVVIVASTMEMMLFGVLSIHGVSIQSNRMLLALLASTAGFVGLFFALNYVFKAFPVPGYVENVLVSVLWICISIAQIPIATKVRS